MSGDENKKFRRVLVVYQGNPPTDFIEVIEPYAEAVTLVSLDMGASVDLLQLPADAMITDSRVEDLTGIGLCVSVASDRLVPTLMLYDERRSWDVEYLTRFLNGTFQAAEFVDDTVENAIRHFLDSTQSMYSQQS